MCMFFSRQHVVIERRHGHVFIHDLSTSGTWLNRVRLVRGGRGSVLRYDDVYNRRASPDPGQSRIEFTGLSGTDGRASEIVTIIRRAHPVAPTPPLHPPPSRLSSKPFNPSSTLLTVTSSVSSSMTAGGRSC